MCVNWECQRMQTLTSKDYRNNCEIFETFLSALTKYCYFTYAESCFKCVSCHHAVTMLTLLLLLLEPLYMVLLSLTYIVKSWPVKTYTSSINLGIHNCASWYLLAMKTEQIPDNIDSFGNLKQVDSLLSRILHQFTYYTFGKLYFILLIRIKLN